jgi:UDP-N-acetylmuramoyl-L-alanyl-D-glutamate--2,6-diaminopimelate ligase
MPLLAELLDDEQVLAVRGPLQVEITAVTSDSRQIVPGALFVCTPGYRAEGGETRADRHEYVGAAIAAGAVAVVLERDVELPGEATVVRARDAWSALAIASSRFYGDPSAQLRVVGITGTSGKTSTSYFVDSVLRRSGCSVARFGTIDYRIGGEVIAASQTTPEAPLLQSLLRRSVDAGCNAVVMEVSSHALALRRVGEVHFDVGVFTNMSRDHLNFHPSMDDYKKAKARLFDSLDGGAVINVDDPVASYMLDSSRGSSVTYGVEKPADVRARNIETTLQGVFFDADTPRGTIAVRLRHLGDYSVYNALAAVAVGEALGIDLEVIGAALAETAAVPGRFELVDTADRDFAVAVDYAHKPDALLRVLQAARRLRPRRLILVFGCGGDRDRGKRPVMGRIASELSDQVIVTSDNPRSEDPRAILDDIVVGVREGDPNLSSCEIEVDRAAAIRRAIAIAGAGDIVLIVGKGHETYQLVGDQRLHFDDGEQARAALDELGKS